MREPTHPRTENEMTLTAMNASQSFRIEDSFRLRASFRAGPQYQAAGGVSQEPALGAPGNDSCSQLPVPATRNAQRVPVR
ncbi:MAG: hypothetical protein NTZ38_03035, partial [Candidatus Taylorbacteria bacterium]|nr:hypothetical protein [Candidatus Taylorbacteria bacterium]